MVERAWPASNFRLVIVDGRAYVDRHKMVPQTSDVFTLWGILQLLRRYPGKLPNLDLMFSVANRPVIKSEDYNATTPPPLFRYCGDDDTVNIVFPGKPTENPEQIRTEFDEISDDEDMEPQEASKTKSRIKVDFTKEHLKRIRQQYRDCLIIKLLGKNIGFKTLMTRITALWNLEGLFTPVDLGLGFYLIRFETRSDYKRVYTGGPWVIQDHYLTVQKWQPDFKADKATAIKTAVWMRFPFLPYEYYDEESLFKIAKELGKPLKVDINTIEGIRASYARVCVELDLSQPLEVSVAIRNEDYLIEYEHIHLICFDCGRVGHRKETCSSKTAPTSLTAGENPTVTITEKPAPKAVNFNGNSVPDETEEIRYGEWMVVTRRKPRKNGPTGNGPQGTNRLQAQSNGKCIAQNVSQNKNKASTSLGPQYRPNENNRDQAKTQQEKAPSPQNQAMEKAAQQREMDKNHRPKPNDNRPKPNGSAQQKEISYSGHKYENNPLLRKQKSNPPDITTMKEVGENTSNGSQPTKPIYSPINSVEVILDIPNPNSSQNPHLKKPPDILTYHEYARTTDCSRELPQGEHVVRTRERSGSLSKRSLVVGGTKIQDQAMPGGNGQPHGRGKRSRGWFRGGGAVREVACSGDFRFQPRTELINVILQSSDSERNRQ
ncbi:hypothetical protein C3L33_03217, partial [Rhododendron williamsianum]